MGKKWNNWFFGILAEFLINNIIKTHLNAVNKRLKMWKKEMQQNCFKRYVYKSLFFVIIKYKDSIETEKLVKFSKENEINY